MLKKILDAIVAFFRRAPEPTSHEAAPAFPPLVTAAELMLIYGCTAERAAMFGAHLNAAMRYYEINTRDRITAFLAQIGHESGRLRYVRELWGPTPAQERYEGRQDLGNTEPGDGRRFMGRGLIQITGRFNYAQVSDAIGHDFIAAPVDLELPKWACLSAAWYWHSRALNELADVGDFERITRRINGGLNGQEDRLAIYRSAQAVIA